MQAEEIMALAKAANTATHMGAIVLVSMFIKDIVQTAIIVMGIALVALRICRTVILSSDAVAFAEQYWRKHRPDGTSFMNTSSPKDWRKIRDHLSEQEVPGYDE